MRILAVDDHPLILEALKEALARSGLGAAQPASSLEAALTLAAQVPAPDLVMLDLGLPGCAGVEALQRFRERFPDLPVVVVSGQADTALIHAALELGAMGFIPKSLSTDLLMQALRLVVQGGIYVPPQALAAVAAPSSMPPLSPRQLEVLGLLMKGMSNKAIARRLDISENTAKIHASAVYRALNVATRTQAVLAASRLGVRVSL